MIDSQLFSSPGSGQLALTWLASSVDTHSFNILQNHSGINP